MRVSTTSSSAGATSRIAVIVQTGCGFLSGGRRGATPDDKEDCYGRATVAFTRTIEHTYIISPLDMAGLIGMAQTLGVYHYGYFTLNQRDIEYHGPNSHPSDQTAVLEWGLGSPFTPQDKPPLAIAMVIRSGDRRKWKRYRLVVARKEKCEKRKPKYTSCALKSTLPYKRLHQTQTPTVVATPQLLSSLQCQIKGTCSTPTPKCTSELLLFSPDATVTRDRSTRTKDGTQPRNNERRQLFHLP